MARPKPVVRVLRPPPEPPPEPAPEEVEGFIRDGRRPQASADVRERPQASANARGRLRGEKVAVTRDDGRERVRMTVYLRPETRAMLARVCADEGREASIVVDEAVWGFLRARGAPR